jgi:hypothetical protein
MMIEFQLERAGHLQTVTDARKQLNDIAGSLSPDQALALLRKLLSPHDDLAGKFVYRLDHAIRLELLVRMQWRLERATAVALYEDLTIKAEDYAETDDLTLQQGLHAMFPRPDEQDARDQFLQALRAPADPKTPTILLFFRNRHGFSPDNRSKLITPTRRVPLTLGVDPDSGTNWMEIRGIVNGYKPGTHQFDFTRTIEQSSWYREGRTWKWEQRRPAGTADDRHNSDEYLFPDQGNIYVIDGPGPTLLEPADPTLRRKAAEYAWMMNAVETVTVTGPSTNAPTPVASLEWFTVTWLERTDAGTWRRKKNGHNEVSEISKGSITGLDGREPPTSW